MSVGASISLPRAPWRDRRGTLSPLRITTLALLTLPAALLLARALTVGLGAEPLAAAINFTGTWGTRILVASLAITPLRRLYDWGKLIDVRRMVGVAAFVYIAAHFTLYAVQQADLFKVATEIASRIYLTLGFGALLGLAALAATSTDGMVRRLGAERWRALHRISYVLIALGLLHAFLQVRLGDYVEPLVLSGLVAFLYLMRWATARGRIGAGRALALALAAAVFTAAGEALYLGIRVGADPLIVLQSQLGSAAGVRPAWVVLAIAAPIAAAGWLRRARPSPSRPSPSAAPRPGAG